MRAPVRLVPEAPLVEVSSQLKVEAPIEDETVGVPVDPEVEAPVKLPNRLKVIGVPGATIRPSKSVLDSPAPGGLPNSQVTTSPVAPQKEPVTGALELLDEEMTGVPMAVGAVKNPLLLTVNTMSLTLILPLASAVTVTSPILFITLEEGFKPVCWAEGMTKVGLEPTIVISGATTAVRTLPVHVPTATEHIVVVVPPEVYFT